MISHNGESKKNARSISLGAQDKAGYNPHSHHHFMNKKAVEHRLMKKICWWCTFLISFPFSHFALVSYNRDSDQLTKWLEASQQTLNYWKEQSLNVSQDLDTIRSNIDSFFVSCIRVCTDNYQSEINIRGKCSGLM